jgi:hypothetical protein
MAKNRSAVALGSLGGKARAKKLSKKRRSEIAHLAVTAWEAKKKRAKADGDIVRQFSGQPGDHARLENLPLFSDPRDGARSVKASARTA